MYNPVSFAKLSMCHTLPRETVFNEHTTALDVIKIGNGRRNHNQSWLFRFETPNLHQF